MYINHRGLVIPKSSISKEEIAKIKEELTLTPKKNHVMMTAVEEKPVLVFRENEKKLYVPRFYGLPKYESSTEIMNKIPSGDTIHTPFVNELRDYQKHIVGVYFDHVKSGSGGAILEVPCGRGKCLGINTPILMHDGTIKKVQHVMVGDKLMGDDSSPREVLSLARGREKMYKITSLEDDESYIANESHILSLQYRDFMGNKNKTQTVDISISQFLNLPEKIQNDFYGYRVAVDFEQDQNIPIDPYDMGIMLGKKGDKMSPIFSPRSRLDIPHGSMIDNPICSALYDMDDELPRRIPFIYKINSRENRLNLLAGIVESECACLKANRYIITHTNTDFIDDVIFVARSLGISAKRFCIEEENIIGCSLYGTPISSIPVENSPNVAIYRKKLLSNLFYRFTITPLEEDKYYGFEIDGNRRFVLGDFTVTHNTIMALNISSVLQKKTLILVHKEFLMNQWIERIRDFVPSARVGKIQASTFDIDNKDIVIGMIQTMYKAEYPSNTFNSFGLTIIDEVHRIGSEEFSKTLFKISTPYMLGISATVDRKDGLTDILYMFIGPKIYHEERKESSTVEVRALMYDHQHESYCTEEFDFRGKIKYSTMVSKISGFPPRQRFLVKILEDLVKENDEKQIMVLSHKRDLLDYLEKSIKEKGFATCGQYVGGMKQSLLVESESKHIVLATYAMAAEALDIKTLNTLVMVSPKTDIIQSVGRILRTEGAGKIIVDVVDSHDVFQNQWRKRKTFYRKSQYIIKQVESSEYKNMTNDQQFKVTFDPTVKSTRSKKNKKSQIDSDEECTESVYPF
jgi:superfamily II DNA or RNA helicase